MLRLCVRSRVRQFINELPDSLDETYERVLKGIPKMNQDHVQRLLQCLVVAIRPLRVDELTEILAFDPDGIEGEVATLDTASSLEDQEQELLFVCPSLITIVDSEGWRGVERIVQFSHFSVKEFLTSRRLSTSNKDISLYYHILHEPAHTTLAQASLEVLLRLDDRVDDKNARNIPLVEYAAEHWVSHIQAANLNPPPLPVIRMMEELFDLDKPHFAAWVRIYDIDTAKFLDCDAPQSLYYAARCGFYGLVEHLINNYPEHINALGGSSDYPLVAALRNRHIQVAELLLQHGANVDGRGKFGLTPLHQEIRHHNYPMLSAVRLLLEHGADVNAQQRDLKTPLHLATAQWNPLVA